MKLGQLLIGLVLLVFGGYSFATSGNDPTIYVQGISAGQGAVLVVWGLREIAGSFVHSSNKKKKE